MTVTPVSQPSCTIDELGDRRLLWQGQLTAGVRQIFTDGNIETGYGEGGVETGTLTPAAVTFRSTNYSVITWTSDDLLTFVLRDQDVNNWRPGEEVIDALRLHVCNAPYDFSSAIVPGEFDDFGGYRWNVGSIWPPGIERTLRLSLPPNHAATGDPVISGTVQVGEELTALTDGIMDEDVLDDVFTYQWVRVDADGTSNEEDITDETDATYTLTADEQGKKVKVEVRFVDILGGEETRTSAATATLAGVPNTAATGAPTITGTAQVGQTLTASTTGIADANGLTTPNYTYQWIRVDGTDEADIAGENSSTYPLGRRRPGHDPQGAGDLRRRPRPYRDAHQRGDGDGGRGSDRPPDGERCGGHVNAGLGQHLLPRGRGHRIHRDVQRPGDGDRHTEVRVQAGRGDAAGRLRERLGQPGVGVRPDGAGRRGRSQRHLVECARPRPRRRDHHADGRDDGREPDPRRAGAAGGAPGGRRPADAGLGVGAGDVAGAGLRRGARSGLDAGDGRVYGDGDGRSHHHEPGGVGGVDIRHLGDADTGRGAGCGRDGDAGVRAGGVEPGAGRGGQRCADVQRPESVRLGPPPPPDLKQVLGVGVAPGNAQLVVTWTEVDNATGYTVQWTSGGQGYNTGDRQATVTSGSTTRYTIPSLTNGTEYTVRVIATRTGADDGPPSDEMTGTPRVPPPPPPPPVTDLAQVLGVGVVPGNAQLVVTWTAVSTATGYTVQWMSGGQGYNTGDRQATVTSGSTTRHTIPSLTNGTPYTVRVIATRTGADDGPPSDEVTGTPTVPPPPRPPPPPDLAQVLGVGVVPGNAQLVVTWTAVDNATGYTVQWMSSGQGYNIGDRQATVTPGSTTRYTIPSLTNGTEYTVRVIATRTGATDGPPSDEMTGTPFTTPGAPQHLSGVPGDEQVMLTWDATSSDGGSAILRYEYAIDDSGTWIDAGLDLEETVPGLTNGQQYAFEVRAVNSAGPGAPARTAATPRSACRVCPSRSRPLGATARSSWSGPSPRTMAARL